jgi:hypothetical protein
LPAGDHKESHEAQVHTTVSYNRMTPGFLKFAMIALGKLTARANGAGKKRSRHGKANRHV